jgi:hypothetical protein
MKKIYTLHEIYTEQRLSEPKETTAQFSQGLSGVSLPNFVEII